MSLRKESNASSSDVYEAIVQLSEPLLTNDDESTVGSNEEQFEEELQQKIDNKVYRAFKLSSLLLGLLVGLFIQLSTLGANFLVITLWGEDVVNKSKSDIMVFSLMWSLFTSAMAVVILGFLRSIVSISFRAMRHETENLLEEMILHMECRFVVGALIGVCVAWTLTDVALGMNAQILYSVATLICALLWCHAMVKYFSRNESNNSSSSSSSKGSAVATLHKDHDSSHNLPVMIV